jgi:hypothetical protein
MIQIDPELEFLALGYPAVSQIKNIQDFGDATVSPAGDAATRVGDVHLPG